MKKTKTKLQLMILSMCTIIILTACDETRSKLVGTQEENPVNSTCVSNYKCCCDTMKFCGIGLQEFKNYVLEYRDRVWKRTSDFGQGEGNGYNPATINADLATGGNLSRVNTLDARYMDVPIDELESYLCAIRNNRECRNVNTVRLYYIRYDTTYSQQVNRSLQPNAYQRKHAIAFVPVEVDYSTGATVYEKLDSTAADSFIWIPGFSNCNRHSLRANHNPLNPPPYDNMGGWLRTLDVNNRLN